MKTKNESWLDKAVNHLLHNKSCPHCQAKVKADEWHYLNGKTYCPMCFKSSVVTEEVSWFKFSANVCVGMCFLLLASYVPFTVSVILISNTKIILLLVISTFLISIIDKKYFAKPPLLDDDSLTAHYPKTALKLLEESSLDELRKKYDVFTANNPDLSPIHHVDLICPNCQSGSVLKRVEPIKNQDAFECLDCGCVSKVDNTLAMQKLDDDMAARTLSYLPPICIAALLIMMLIFDKLPSAGILFAWGGVAICFGWGVYLLYQHTVYERKHRKRGKLVAFE